MNGMESTTMNFICGGPHASVPDRRVKDVKWKRKKKQ